MGYNLPDFHNDNAMRERLSACIALSQNRPAINTVCITLYFPTFQWVLLSAINQHCCQLHRLSTVHWHVHQKQNMLVTILQPFWTCMCPGEEPCVTAHRSNDLTTVTVKYTPFPRCSEWAPFNATYGSKQGFPKRTIQVPLNINHRMSGVARRITATEFLTGRATTHAYEAYMLDSLGNKHVLTDGYEILVVGCNCSTAWVSYTAGDSIPTSAVVAGKDNLTGRYHYVVFQREANYICRGCRPFILYKF